MIPRWLSLLFLVVLGLMLYQVGGLPRRHAAEPSPVAPEPPRYPAIAQTFDAEHWKQALNPDYAAQMRACDAPPRQAGKLGITVTVEQAGKGAAAQCGEAVTLQVRHADSRGVLGVAKPWQLTLGKSGVAGLDAALVGMQPGESRTLLVPPVKGKIPAPLQPFISASQVSILNVTR